MAERDTQRGAHKVVEAIIVSSCPDVCKTPIGNSVVPVPYTLFSTFADAQNTAVDVNFEGIPSFHAGSHLPTVTGNEAGTKGGVKSGVNVGICNPLEMSSSVRVNGQPAIRNVDEMHMNAPKPVNPGQSRNVQRADNKKSGSVLAKTDPTSKTDGDIINKLKIEIISRRHRFLSGKGFTELVRKDGQSINSRSNMGAELRVRTTDEDLKNEFFADRASPLTSKMEYKVGNKWKTSYGMNSDPKPPILGSLGYRRIHFTGDTNTAWVTTNSGSREIRVNYGGAVRVSVFYHDEMIYQSTHSFSKNARRSDKPPINVF